MLSSVAEVLELIGAAGEHLLTAPRGAAPAGRAGGRRRVLDAVPVRKPVGVARLAARAVSPGRAAVAASAAGAGLVEQRDGGWRLTTLGAS